MKRINVTLAENAHATLKELAKRQGKSISEVVRVAVAREKWIADVMAGDGHLFLRQNGEVKTLVIL